MAKARILIIEDVRQTVDELRDHLELYGYETEVALTAPVGVSVVEQRQMDLAVVGENVHEISGLDILNKLRELAPELNIVLITAQKSKRYQASLLKSGAQGVLVQPLDKAESLALVEGVLKRSAKPARKRKRAVRIKKKAKAKARPGVKIKSSASKKVTKKKVEKRVKKR